MFQRLDGNPRKTSSDLTDYIYLYLFIFYLRPRIRLSIEQIWLCQTHLIWSLLGNVLLLPQSPLSKLFDCTTLSWPHYWHFFNLLEFLICYNIWYIWFKLYRGLLFLSSSTVICDETLGFEGEVFTLRICFFQVLQFVRSY